MNTLKAIVTMSLVLLLNTSLSAVVVTVPGDAPTIQAGINAASAGDTVLVAAGTYTGNGNHDIDFGGKAVVVMSANGPVVTIVDVQGNSGNLRRGFIFQSGEGSGSVVKGFTIKNGWDREGGAIACRNGSSPVIEDNIIVDNTAADAANGEGGGIFCEDGSSPSIVGNIVKDNLSDGEGGGIFCRDFASPSIEDNVIANNITLNDGGGIAVRDNSFPTVIHTILWDDAAPVGSEIHVEGGSTITVTFSDVEGGFTGNGNINADPEFVLVNNQDVRLLGESPCIDTGNPVSFDADGTRRDIGAHFFDQDDFLTIYLTPDELEVAPGGQIGVTYTLINRMPQVEPFWILTQISLPSGGMFPLVGPDQFSLPADFTAQVHLMHDVPLMTPDQRYGYKTLIGVPPSTLYDEDSFTLRVVSP